MNYPEDHVMGSLAAINAGMEFAISEPTNRMAVRTPIGWWEVFDGEIDMLFDKGWIEHPSDDRVQITESGKYWLKRWMEKQRSLSRKRR